MRTRTPSCAVQVNMPLKRSFQQFEVRNHYTLDARFPLTVLGADDNVTHGDLALSVVSVILDIDYDLIATPTAMALPKLLLVCAFIKIGSLH